MTLSKRPQMERQDSVASSQLIALRTPRSTARLIWLAVAAAMGYLAALATIPLAFLSALVALISGFSANWSP